MNSISLVTVRYTMKKTKQKLKRCIRFMEDTAEDSEPDYYSTTFCSSVTHYSRRANPLQRIRDKSGF